MKILLEEITQCEFEEWGEKCDKIIDEFDELAKDDLRYILENLESENHDYDVYWTWGTDDYNVRLNWLLTYQIVQLQLSKPLLYKYSVCPQKVEEWEKDDNE